MLEDKMSITVMKQALEALEKCAVMIDGEWGSCRSLVEMDETDCLPQGVRGPIIALRIAIAAAEKQEAAERYIHEYRSKPHPGDFGIPRGHWWQAKQYADVLYTTPPAAQRQPLTEERIGQIIEQCKITLVNYCSGEKQTEFARAIEAAHGIKETNT
jgi:hypothetical protein